MGETVKILLNLLDIAVIAFILYKLYGLLSRTKAVPLLIGFGIIALSDVIARWLHLETLSWLVTNVSSYLVIGLIVLLQPELRRLVGEMGQMPVFKWINPSVKIPLDEIIESVRNMASTRTGSIIVLLREIRPQTIIDNAVRVDSRITRELLQTIFFKDTPLHDGAVLIEGDRIVAASCYLPLSDSSKLKKTHGARHRAGMGMSEETDAVVIVTSEETGKISVMVNGDLHSTVKSGELKNLLQSYLTDRARRGIKDLFRTGESEVSESSSPSPANNTSDQSEGGHG